MTLNIARSLPRLRKLLNQTLPDTARNARTGATVRVRVDDTGRTRGIPGLPTFIEIPVWSITAPDFTPVTVGDILTVTNAEDGSVAHYSVTVVFAPESYTVSTDMQAVRIDMGTHGNLPLPANASIVLSRQRDRAAVALDAYVFPLDADLSPQRGDYRLQAVVGGAAAYPDGGLLRANDLITCPTYLGTDQNGTPTQGVITQPRRTVGILPFITFMFREQP